MRQIADEGGRKLAPQPDAPHQTSGRAFPAVMVGKRDRDAPSKRPNGSALRFAGEWRVIDSESFGMDLAALISEHKRAARDFEEKADRR
jgi:hypothetical protein